MYRICIAVNGYYYVQRKKFSGWCRVGGFFPTRGMARQWANSLRQGRSWYPVSPSVVEYL